MKKPLKLITSQSLLDKVAKKKRTDLLADVKVTGDLAEDCKEELSETLKAFKARAKNENDRMQNATDSEHWIAISFKSRDQKESFLEAMKWAKAGDKYLDGETVAEISGVALPHVDLARPRDKKGDKLCEMPSIRSLLTTNPKP